MSSFDALALQRRRVGPPLDLVGLRLNAASVEGGQLRMALLTQQDREKLGTALIAARNALADAEACHSALLEALAPAEESDIQEELTRLVRSWPQDKRGDLAGYAVELALFVLERRPSRRGLQQACRALKLGQVHLPSIAEVMAALASAEGSLLAAAEQLGDLPERIARAEAVLAQGRPAATARESKGLL